MRKPDFTAEVSLYKTSEQYYLAWALTQAQEGAYPAAQALVGTRLEYECTPSGSVCACTGVFDCLIMGKDGKCEGKTGSCSNNKCVCY
jgi:hypothetical protein